MSEQTLRPAVEKTAVSPLSGAWLQGAKVTWTVLAITALALLAASLPGYAAKFGGQLGHVTGSETPPGAHFFAAASGAASLASALLALGLSALLFRRKFTEPMAAFLSFFLLIYGVVMSGPLEFTGWYWLGSADFAYGAQSVLLATPLVALLMLFPNGRFVPGWTRWVVLLSVPWNVGLLLLGPYDARGIDRQPTLAAVVAVLFIAFISTGIYAQIYRYRKTSTAAERQQIRWAIYGFVLSIAYIIVSSVPYYYLTGLPPDAPTPWWGPASELGWWLSLNILPVCFTIAITRYRLWDIDLVINRTLVYGALTASVIALYALIVGGMGLLFRTEDSVLLPLLATGVAAVLFHPLRLRLQRGVNRFMYGERDEPFDVLARLGQRLESTLSPEMVYPTIVETVSQALKLPYTAVAVWRNGRLQTVESYGKPAADPVTYPLTYQGESVGQLLAARRAPDEAFSPADERILRNLARQAGAAVHAVQLMADLQRSREKLVTMREEERRRLRRDLHDGLGPRLAAHMLRLGSARALLERDPAGVDEILSQLEDDAEETLAEIRRLVYQLRPPALDQLGLIGAIEESAAQYEGDSLAVTVAAPPSLPPLPAAVEVATYRIVQEALANVACHAQAQHCEVRLVCEGDLRVTIRDDGVGLPAAYRAGVGLASMRERAAELGGQCEITPSAEGGTQVSARLPLSGI